MTIFLTGGTGFIGSNFIEKASKSGHQIIAIYREGRVPISNKNITWIKGDLSSNYRQYLSKCDAVVHLASHGVVEGSNNLDECLHWNVHKTYELCKQAYESNIDKFIVGGSCFEYGKAADRYQFIPVTAALEPVTDYAVSKAIASILLHRWASENNIYMHIMRFFHVYGEGEHKDRLWPSLKRAALNGEDFKMTKGEQVRDFISVNELSHQIIQALSFESLSPGCPKISNIGSGEPLSVRDFCSFWWEKWEAKGKLLVGSVPYRDNEVMRYVPDISND